MPGIIDPLPISVPHGDTRAWAFADHVRERHIVALKSVLTMEFPKQKSGDKEGIVYVGGGRYWPMIVVGIRMARRFTDLPIQVWHSGSAEPVEVSDLAGISGVTIHDVTALGYPLRRVGGWENKTTAILHSGFDRLIYLDADAYLVDDPRAWLEATRESGFTFWSDLPWNDETVSWDWTGVQNVRRVPPIQGGQLGFDLGRVRRSIFVSHWINQHSDYFYHHQYGDQDSWRIALAATGEAYHCLGSAGWQPPAFVCRYPSPLVVHRCQAKLWGTSQVTFAHDLPWEGVVRMEYNRQVIGTGTPAEVFSRIYKLGMWGEAGSSGAGSSDPEARPLLDTLAYMQLLAGWRSVADLGCGDGRVARQLPFPEVIGVDCCADLVARNAAGRDEFTWMAADLVADRESLPIADVALVKDVLHHWPTQVIREWLTWAQTCGKWQWLFLVSDCHQQADEDDCCLGGYRAVNPGMVPLKEFPLMRVAEYLHKAILAMDLRASCVRAGSSTSTPVKGKYRVSI